MNHQLTIKHSQMQLKLTLILAIFSLASCSSAQKIENRQPHELWRYWNNKYISDASMVTQVCINNIKKPLALISGWEVMIVDNNSVFDHISQENGKRPRFFRNQMPGMTRDGLTPQCSEDLPFVKQVRMIQAGKGDGSERECTDKYTMSQAYEIMLFFASITAIIALLYGCFEAYFRGVEAIVNLLLLKRNRDHRQL